MKLYRDIISLCSEIWTKYISDTFKIFPESLHFWEIKKIQSFKLHYYKILPFYNHTLLPATVKVSELFLEAILWEPFQLFRRILNDVSTITKAPSLQCWFQSTKQVTVSRSQVRRVWGMLQCCHIVPWPKPTGVLEHFSVLFLLTAFLRLRKMSMYRNFPHTGIPVNYTSKFRELFETTKGMDSGWK